MKKKCNAVCIFLSTLTDHIQMMSWYLVTFELLVTLFRDLLPSLLFSYYSKFIVLLWVMSLKMFYQV